MGVDLYYGYYPKKCNDPEIIPYLDTDVTEFDSWMNGKHQHVDFYNDVRECSIENKENNCFIFDDATKLFDFASRESCPVIMSDYITNNYQDGLVLILWGR